MKQTIDLLASDFDVDLARSYSLSIRQFPDGYSFCIMDYAHNKCMAIKQIKLVKSSNQLAREPLLQLNYHDIVYYGYGAFSVVPKSFIVNDDYASFLPIEPNLQQRAKVLVNPVFDETVIICHTNQWSQPEVLIESHHEIEALITYALKQNYQSALFAEIISDRINVVAVNDHKLQLINSYNISTETDAAYYIMASYQQLSLSQENATLFLMGNLQEINPTDFLSTYIKNISIIKPKCWNSEFNNDIAPFFTLQTLSNILCE